MSKGLTIEASQQRRLARVVGIVGVALLVVGGLPAAALARVDARLSAEDNVGASIAWSQFGFDDAAVDTVFLARDDVFADSLASGSLQGLNNAPLLLTDPDELSEETAAELQRLFPRSVVILGGDQAVSLFVEAELADLGFDVARVFDSDRVGTATRIADDFFGEATSAVVARAFGTTDDPTTAFADSMAAGSFAAQTGVPVLLSAQESLSPATAAYLAASSIQMVFVAGGEAALSAQVVDDLSALGITVTRVAGPNRAATAAEFARLLSASEPPDRVLLIDGQREDSWASGFPAAAITADSGVLLLTLGDVLPAETADFGLSGPTICGPFVTETACDAADSQDDGAATVETAEEPASEEPASEEPTAEASN